MHQPEVEQSKDETWLAILIASLIGLLAAVLACLSVASLKGMCIEIGVEVATTEPVQLVDVQKALEPVPMPLPPPPMPLPPQPPPQPVVEVTAAPFYRAEEI